jgi:hypothetical protein
MEDFGIGSLKNSVRRLQDSLNLLKMKKDPMVLIFMQRESWIALKRAIKVWWNLRFGRDICKPGEESSSSSGDLEK